MFIRLSVFAITPKLMNIFINFLMRVGHDQRERGDLNFRKIQNIIWIQKQSQIFNSHIFSNFGLVVEITPERRDLAEFFFIWI